MVWMVVVRVMNVDRDVNMRNVDMPAQSAPTSPLRPLRDRPLTPAPALNEEGQLLGRIIILVL